MTRARSPWRILALLSALAILGPLLAPYAPDAVDLAQRRQPPTFAHPFGTDDLGRDVLTRALHGARISIAIGIIAAAASVAIGALVGLTAGLFGRRVDAFLMRATDAMLSVPRLPFLMTLAAILQPSIALLILLVAIVGWMETARVVRAEVLSLVPRGFVEAARALGVARWNIIHGHLLPNVAGVITVSATLAVGRSMLLESALSFFGVGVQPPTASWGNMLYQAQAAMTTEPWVALFPGVAIFATVWLVNHLGERLGRSPST